MKKALAKFKQDLLFGTSHMIPFIVAGGIVGNVIGFLMNVINHAP